ncbi:MAG TPA: ABC transporter permease, partial [Phycisphaerae bacterium]
MLARSRGTSIIALIILALGIGANTAIFSLVNAVLLRPVPGVQEPEQLVRFMRLQSRRQLYSFGYPDYADYRDQSRMLAGVIAEGQAPLSFALGNTQRVAGSVVTGNYFSMLGVRPAAGRLFTPDDDRTPGGHWVAVISHGLWQRAFGAEPAAIGQKVLLNGHTFTIIGVAEEEFHGLTLGDKIDAWLPMAMQEQAIPRLVEADLFHNRSAGWLRLYGRVRSGVHINQARAEIAGIANRLAQMYPKTNEGRMADLTAGIALYPEDRARFRTFFGLLLSAVGVLLLIACGNVANLLLARATIRKKEMAVRLAMGASRRRLIRQLLIESGILCLIAAAFALVVAPWTVQLLLKLAPPAEFALQVTPRLDWTVLGFAMLVSVSTAILFGLAPALAASRTDVATSLKDAAPASGFQRSPLSRLLVVAQVSLSLVLLIGAGLVLRSMQRILAIDRGFDSSHVLLSSVDLAIQGYSETKGRLFLQQLLERVSQSPGVRAASIAQTDPARGWGTRVSVFYEGQAPPPDVIKRRDDIGIRVEVNFISPGYFDTFGIPLMAGHDFGAQDQPGALPVAIVSQKLANQLWPGENPIGKRIVAPLHRQQPEPPVTIVGVAKDARYRSLMADAPLLLYVPLLQVYAPFVRIQVRTAGDPAAFTQVLGQQVKGLDSNLPVYGVTTLDEQVSGSLWQQRTAAGLIGSFGALALVLASVGLYSVMAQVVAHRT